MMAAPHSTGQLYSLLPELIFQNQFVGNSKELPGGLGGVFGLRPDYLASSGFRNHYSGCRTGSHSARLVRVVDGGTEQV
jgi:hypothetical protein